MPKKTGPIAIDPEYPFFYPKDLCTDIPFAVKEIIVPGRSSDFWIILVAAPSHSHDQWRNAAVVPKYSGGPVPDFNRIPYYAIVAPETTNSLATTAGIVNTLFRRPQRRAALPAQ